MRKLDIQVDAHKIVSQILKRYPIIESVETHEADYGAIIKLNLGGFKKGKTTTYSYPNVIEGLLEATR